MKGSGRSKSTRSCWRRSTDAIASFVVNQTCYQSSRTPLLPTIPAVHTAHSLTSVQWGLRPIDQKIRDGQDGCGLIGEQRLDDRQG